MVNKMTEKEFKRIVIPKGTNIEILAMTDADLKRITKMLHGIQVDIRKPNHH